MFRCPSCCAEAIAWREILLSSRWSPIVCQACGSKCRLDFTRLWKPLWLMVIAQVSYFSVKYYSLTLHPPSLLILYAALLLDIIWVASGLWMLFLVVAGKLPLKPK